MDAYYDEIIHGHNLTRGKFSLKKPACGNIHCFDCNNFRKISKVAKNNKREKKSKKLSKMYNYDRDNKYSF